MTSVIAPPGVAAAAAVIRSMNDVVAPGARSAVPRSDTSSNPAGNAWPAKGVSASGRLPRFFTSIVLVAGIPTKVEPKSIAAPSASFVAPSKSWISGPSGSRSKRIASATTKSLALLVSFTVTTGPVKAKRPRLSQSRLRSLRSLGESSWFTATVSSIVEPSEIVNGALVAHLLLRLQLASKRYIPGSTRNVQVAYELPLPLAVEAWSP